MKKIILTESQFHNLIAEASMENTFGKEYSLEIAKDKEMIHKLLRFKGRLMTANDNNKAYNVYYLAALSKIVGKDYVMCRLFNFENGKNYGSTYVKPLKLFRDYNQNDIYLNRNNGYKF